MKDEIKEILEKFNKEVEKAELTRNPYSNEDKKFKHILVSLSEEHFNIFKDILDYITNLQEENEKIRFKMNSYEAYNHELENKINKAIKTIEKNENKAPIEVVLNDIAKALKILKEKSD